MTNAPIRRGLRVAASLALFAGVAGAGEAEAPAQVRRAIAYLDARQEAWAKFSSAARGTGEDRTVCLSCHTGISFALARPSIGPFAGEAAPSAAEERMVQHVARRVEHWGELDSPRFRLMYDFDARKKVESRGTEAVLDALILARAGDRSASAARAALAHLWEAQAIEGEDAGSWDWLNFGLEPWEGKGSRAFGAALAALAVGSSPAPLDERGSRGVGLLRDYLRRRYPRESLHNRLWILEASATFPGLASAEQERETLGQLRAARRDDGGWSLATFGDFPRVDGSDQAGTSDGYATGLALRALIRSGSPASGPEVAPVVAWLRTHQREDGSWPGISVNKERDPATFTGKLMTDAATAFAASALVEAGSK